MKKILSLFVLGILPFMSNAQSFTNVDLEGSIGISALPIGWQNVPRSFVYSNASTDVFATVDLCDATGPIPDMAGIACSGSTFVLSSDGWGNTSNNQYKHEGLQQLVSGLSIGCTYQVTFCQAVSRSNLSQDSSGAWRLYIDNTIAGTSASSSTTDGYTDINLDWETRSIAFTATATSHLIRLMAQDDDDNHLSIDPQGAVRMAIDLISINTSSTTVTINAVTPQCESSAPISLTASPTGGTWSGTGITDATLGTFNPSIAGVGIHDITYTTTGTCAATEMISIEVTPSAADASWTVPTGLCTFSVPINLSNFITGDPGGTWSGTGIIDANLGRFDPGIAGIGTHNITYTVGTAPCQVVQTNPIAVSTSPDASWTVPTGLCPSSAPIDLSTLITGTAGGTFNGTGISGTLFDPSVGTQSITYGVVSASCEAYETQTITVTSSAANASWTVPTGLCISSAPIDLSALITGTAGGTFNGMGVSGSMFDPSVGTQSITYTVGTSPCGGTSTQTITVTTSAADASWTVPTGLCPSSAPINLSTFITGNSGGTWSGTGIIDATLGRFDPGIAGIGTHDITYTVGTASCEAFLTQTITISEPGTVTILDIAIQDWSQNNNSITVVMDNPGNYAYSLDDVNYQDSNSFYNLETGDYRVYVKTKEGCGSAEEDIYLLNYPKFFTPNGDGINDTWQIFHSNRELNNRIFIYDRYGKLLTEISPSGPGWDGTYNGASLHSDDYWFVIERTEIGKTFRAHFSLKR